MNNQNRFISATAVKGIASGMCLMAFFTMLWAAVAFGGLYKTGFWYGLLIFPALSIAFISGAVRLFRIAIFFPGLTAAADIAEEKKKGKWFGLIFGLEGFGIFIGINIVINIGYPNLQIPVIALVVGLHFFPMAKIFRRTVDYYLATWSTLIAVLSIIFTVQQILSKDQIFAFTGIGMAIATSCYGLFMLAGSRRLQKPALQTHP